MSPPCIAFFDGPNGGATAKGVTDAEIRVVFATCSGTATTITEDLDTNSTDQTAALLRYFGDRYQTYGRRVHGWRVQRPCSGEAQNRAVSAEIDERFSPFALARGTPIMADEAARLGIWASLNGGGRAEMARRAPLFRSYAPDRDDVMVSTAQFVCHKLADRVARYTGDPLMQTTRRKFAIQYFSPYGPREAALRTFLRTVEEDCASDVGEVLVAPASDASPQLTIAQWREAGVTTVIDVGVTFSYTTYADSMGWHPEWLFVPDVFRNDGIRQLVPATQARNLHALTFARRLDPPRESNYGYQALKSACSACSGDVFTEAIYAELLVLFWGIQAAGPRLTIENVDRGLHQLPQLRSPDPWTPAAYFAPGNWSFVKDMMLAKWDPAGVVANQPPGCWRLVEQGKRYRAQDWASSPGDDGFDRFDEWRCQSD